MIPRRNAQGVNVRSIAVATMLSSTIVFLAFAFAFALASANAQTVAAALVTSWLISGCIIGMRSDGF